MPEASGGRLPRWKPVKYFTDPCGDIHELRPIKAIWIRTERVGFFRSKIHEVRLDYSDGEFFVWDFKSEDAAKAFRDKLIAAVQAT